MTTSWGFEVLIPSYSVKYLAECRTWHSNLSKMFDSGVPTARHHSTRYTGESEVPIRVTSRESRSLAMITNLKLHPHN